MPTQPTTADSDLRGSASPLSASSEVHTLESLQRLAETEQGREDLNRLLGTLLGWTDIHPCSCKVRLSGTHPIHAPALPEHLPRWTHDLNACAVVECTLNDEQCHRYNRLLIEVKPPRIDIPHPSLRWTWCSPPTERTIALILTLQPPA